MAGHAASPLSVTSVALVRSLAVSSTLLLLLIQAVLLGGCAGQKLAYGDIVARVDASGTAPVAVAAHDQRKLITSGQESPTFVGRMRSQHHIAGVNTASGKPLGDDLTTVLATSLAAKGFKAIPVVVSHSERPEAVTQRMVLMRVDRDVVLTVAEWRTDTYFKTQLFYELDLKVLDSSGKVLAQRRLAGHEDEMSGSARDAFRQKLELLINDPEVTQALTFTQSPATVQPVAPTQPPAPPPPAASSQPPAMPVSPDVATQLQKLKELYEKGLVTEDVYKERMREILNKL
jgi:hypothetical protein